MERLAEQVPLAHLQLVLLHGAGVDDATIAARLAIPGEAFQATLEVASAKILAAFDPSKEPSMTALDVASIHRRFVDEVVVAKRVHLLDELFASDAVLEQGSLKGLRAQMQAQADGLDLTVTYVHELVADDWVVHHMQISITHVGDFMGVAGTGRVAQLAEVEAARVADGRIIEMWSVADIVGAMHQLGIALPTASDGAVA